MKILSVLAILMVGLHLTDAHAWGDRKIGVQLPPDMTKFQGAFEGEMNGQEANMLIAPTHAAGSFIVALIVGDPYAQIFYGELVDDRKIGLYAIGLNSDNSDIDDKKPPAGFVQITADQSNKIEKIHIVPQSGIGYLRGEVHLNHVSDAYQFGGATVAGKYEGKDHANVTVQRTKQSKGHQAWSLSGHVPQLDLSNEYNIAQVITGVQMLNAQSFEEYLQKKEQRQVTAFVINILKHNRPALLILRANQEAMSTSAVVLTRED